MGLLDSLKRLFGLGGASGPAPAAARSVNTQQGKVLGLEALAGRLGLELPQLQQVTPAYRQFRIAKRSGGTRTLSAPEPALKRVQRTVARRLLARLPSHPAATGFERGYSIAINAAAHAGSAVVLRMDIREFFHSTTAPRVRDYFRLLGWDPQAAELLTTLCTHQGHLPQGAPTSPRLSNLVNYLMDVRLAGLAARVAGLYTRYADDITFSFPVDNREAIRCAIRMTKIIVKAFGYRLHHKRKLSIRRQHQCQRVTGLVVNDHVALPRRTRRWLRAVEHHVATGRPASLSPAELAGWRSLQHMIATQAPRTPSGTP